MELDIPMGVDVHCRDGLCGRSTYVLVNPVHEQVTHLVVKGDDERIVPISMVSETTPEVILLDCDRDEFARLDPFVETHFIDEPMPSLRDGPIDAAFGGTYLMWPYAVPERIKHVPVKQKQVPAGELAVRRGARVHATDGRVGRVDEFLVNPQNDDITHLVMRGGRMWGERDVTIPLSAIDRLSQDDVYLTLSKRQIGALPAIPIRR